MLIETQVLYFSPDVLFDKSAVELREDQNNCLERSPAQLTGFSAE